MKSYITTKIIMLGLPRHDFWDSIKGGFEGIISKLQVIAPISAALAFVVIGFMMMYSNKTRELAKSSLPWVIAGLLLIFGATALAMWTKGVAVF